MRKLILLCLVLACFKSFSQNKFVKICLLGSFHEREDYIVNYKDKPILSSSEIKVSGHKWIKILIEDSLSHFGILDLKIILKKGRKNKTLSHKFFYQEDRPYLMLYSPYQGSNLYVNWFDKRYDMYFPELGNIYSDEPK